MSKDTPRDPDKQSQKKKRRKEVVLLLTGVVVIPVVSYLAYNLLIPVFSPCESIFRQTQVKLSTKVKLIKTEGEVQVGPEKIQELTERAQVAALNLKTCCIVLDGGRMNPEEFLECKSNAREYDQKVNKVLTLVRKAKEDDTQDKEQQESINQEIAAAVQSATKTSRNFNKRIVKIRESHQYAQLEPALPDSVEIDKQEKEPNDSILSPNTLKLGSWVNASIVDSNDKDYYSFTTPAVYRDYISINLENRSTTLSPHLEVLDGNKVHSFDRNSNTPGANLTTRFVAEPETRFYLMVSRYSKSKGAYLLRVSADKAYDKFEPNEHILAAKPIKPGSPVQAQIMDPGDHDFYFFAAKKDGTITASLENRSTTLSPYLEVRNADKVHVADRYSSTPGANLTYSFPVKADTRFYIHIARYSKSHGDYTLNLAYD